MSSKVLLDSCVLFPFMLRDTLLTLAERGLFCALWTQEILDGATKNLVVRNKISEKQASTLQLIIKEFFPQSLIETPSKQAIEAMTNHEGDRHVLAAAIQAKAEIIVTFNLKHFPHKLVAPLQIQVVHPDVFLTRLFFHSPDNVISALKEQADRLKRPRITFEELLQKLEHQTPVFVSQIRDEM